MCGLCGVVDLGRPPQTGTVRRMAAARDHRGPQGDGSFTDDGGARGFRRLALIAEGHTKIGLTRLHYDQTEAHRAHG